MKTLLSLLFLLLLFPAQALSQKYKLPSGARIIETRAIPSKAHANRALVMWMVNPKRNPRDTPDEPYTCPEETRGHYYSGPLRVSLVDTRTRRVINTLQIIPDYYDDEDSFDIPYKIHNGYYTVTGLRPGQKEGVPVIMLLKDYNGDGRAQEFALFDALACMGLPTTLIGYSESKDRVIQYPVNVQISQGESHWRNVLYWPDYLFGQKPAGQGYWKYEIDYRGRGGSLDKWEIRYNRRLEAFEGTITHVPGD
ncbi:MAG TPA: hypothetical protein VF543_18165 [Pyrinomonadaceae bacterium]